MIDKLNVREKTLLFITVFAVFVYAAISFVIDPVIMKKQQLSQMLEQKSLKLLSVQSEIKDKSAIEDFFSNLPEIPKTSDSDEVNQSNLLTAINELQQKAGIQINNMIPLKTEVISSYKKFMVQVEMQDRVENIIKFLIELNNTQQKLSLSNLRITPERSKSDELKASFTVVMLLGIN